MKILQKRPILVWVICTCYLITVPVVIHDWIYPRNPEALFENALSILIIIGFWAGAVALFLLRKQALWLYLGTMLVCGVNMILHASSSNEFFRVGKYLVSINVLDCIVPFLVCLYMFKLSRAGVLK